MESQKDERRSHFGPMLLIAPAFILVIVATILWVPLARCPACAIDYLDRKTNPEFICDFCRGRDRVTFLQRSRIQRWLDARKGQSPGP